MNMVLTHGLIAKLLASALSRIAAITAGGGVVPAKKIHILREMNSAATARVGLPRLAVLDAPLGTTPPPSMTSMVCWPCWVGSPTPLIVTPRKFLYEASCHSLRHA